MQPDQTIWREPVARFEGMNVRSGASDLENSDYENFPPNYLCTYDTYENYPDLLWNFVDAGNLTLENGIDQSICYVGIKNPELPQLNFTSHGRYGFYDEANPFFITDNTQIQGVFFVATGNAQQFSSYFEWEGNALYNENYVKYKMRRYNGEKGQASYLSPQSNSNSNLFLNIYQKIGIKNFIFEIRVQYKTGTNQYGVTAAETTLAGYVSQTDAWKESHPIVSAYGIPYWRYGTDGEYRNSSSSGDNKNITAAFTLPFIYSGANPNENYSSIYNYAINYSNNTTCGYLPIYGSRGDHSEPKAVAQDHGKVGVLIGANKGTYHYSFSSGYNNMWLELEGTDDNIEWLRRGMAAYGLFFCDEIGTLAQAGKDPARWIDDKMCLGTIDDNGHTNGDYTHGFDNTTQRQFTWKTTAENNYNPYLPPQPENEYSNTTTFNSIGDIVTLTQRYVLNGTAVSHLGRELWSITADMIDDGGGGEDFTELNDKILDTFLTNNPIDCIVSLQRFPLEIPKTANAVKIKLGKAETQVSAYQMEKTAYTYLFTGKPIAPKFGDSFLDYEPYTKMELYIPFCGTVQLNPADIIDRQLNVQLVVDFCTGTCTGFVMSDDLVIETVNGNIAIDIPVTGMQSATVASQLNNAIAAKTSAQKTIFNSQVGVITPAGFVKFALNPLSFKENIDQAKISEQRADYELRHQNAALHIIGSASPAGGWAIDLNCRLIIYYPSGEVIRTAKPPEWNDTALARYGRTTGFACCIENSIGSMSSGLVVGINPDLNGMVTESTAALPATAAEIDLIRAAIEEGVII